MYIFLKYDSVQIPNNNQNKYKIRHSRILLGGFGQIDALARKLSGVRQAVIRQSTGNHQAVIRQSLGSHQTGIRQSLAVIDQSLVSPWAVIRQSLGIWQHQQKNANIYINSALCFFRNQG